MLTWWLCITLFYLGCCICVGKFLFVSRISPRISSVVFSSPDSGSSGKQEVANSFPAALVLYSSTFMQSTEEINRLHSSLRSSVLSIPLFTRNPSPTRTFLPFCSTHLHPLISQPTQNYSLHTYRCSDTNVSREIFCEGE